MLKSLLPLFEHSFQEKAKRVIDQDTETHPLSRVELSSVLTSFLWVIIISESLLGTFPSYFYTKESLLVQWLPHWLCSDNPFTPTLLLGSGIRIHLFLRKKSTLKTPWPHLFSFLSLPLNTQVEYFQAIPPTHHRRGS